MSKIFMKPATPETIRETGKLTHRQRLARMTEADLQYALSQADLFDLPKDTPHYRAFQAEWDRRKSGAGRVFDYTVRLDIATGVLREVWYGNYFRRDVAGTVQYLISDATSEEDAVERAQLLPRPSR
jgi:hypothetical protein